MGSAKRPSLVALIKERFKRDRIVPPLAPGDYIRASSLAGLCPREEVLASRLKRDRVDRVSADANVNFALGTGMHWTFQNTVCRGLAEADAPVLFGQWRCIGCGSEVGGTGTAEGFIPLPRSCKGCGKDPSSFEYVEQWLVDHTLRLTGHCDGSLLFPFLLFPEYEPLEMGLLELKSIAEHRSLAIRDVPDLGHVCQMQAYMHLTGHKWGLLIYWIKGVFRDPFVEHFIERDEGTIEKIKSELASIWVGVDTGVLPERICSSADCRRADECPLTSECFLYQDYVPEFEAA